MATEYFFRQPLDRFFAQSAYRLVLYFFIYLDFKKRAAAKNEEEEKRAKRKERKQQHK